MSNLSRIGWILLLALLAGPAMALGLGQIEVRSQAGQPLLAEIPIVSSDPSELEALQARLASPETFARIGLEPPQGVVSNLQFAVALDPRGRPVIRVTSAVPVQQPLLTFLIEVDWGRGRLVREYSALLDTPQTVAAPSQPPIEAPRVAPADTIVRPPVASAPVAAPPTPVPAPATPPAPTPAPSPVTPPPATVAAQVPPPQPTAPPPAPAAPAAPVASAPGEYGPVKAGDTLGRIASGITSEGYTLDQTMVALLRANPDAFIDGNLNLIRTGAVLRMPQGVELSQYTAAEAAAVVREHIGQWREARRPPPQPAALAETAATNGESAGRSGAAARSAVTSTAVAAARADGRLEITPPSGAGQRAGTRSGIDAGGEGDMLRQELQQANETLAARSAEVDELKARVADLEKLQQQQQQLISMKDSELAAAQQRLAESNARPAPTLAAAATPDAASPASATANTTLWIGGGVALLVAALLVAWLMRRRPAPATERFRADTLAAAVPPPTVVPPIADAPVDAGRDSAEPVVREPVAPPATTPARVEPSKPEAAPKPAAEPPVPSFAAGALSSKPAPEPEPPASATPSFANATPAWHSGTTPAVTQTPPPAPVSDAATVAPLNATPAGHDRIELAQAYLDLGDVDTARTLLQEVADTGDAAARDEAARLLRTLA